MIEIDEDNVLKVVEMGLIFGVPDKGQIRQVCEQVKKIIAERDEARSKLNQIREVMAGWQHCVEVHQLAHKIERVLGD